MRKLIGAGHGFFGNVHAMLRRQEWLPDSQRELLYSRAALTAVKSATWADGMVNWMPSFGSENTKPLMQWCHGAPGAITSFALFPKNYSSELETVLLKAGEAIWKSGPLNKGVAICHGTDGNGFAFLRLFDRTGDEMWLDRAKKFAMHSLTQKNGRSTLWTGEIGLAMFLLACVDHKPDFPTLDSF